MTAITRHRAHFLVVGVASLLFGASVAQAAPFDVTGTFQYQDRIWDKNGYTGATQNLPIRHADVEVVNVNTSGVLGSGRTDANGQFTITANASGTVSLYVRVLTRTGSSPDYHVTVATNSIGTQIHAALTDNFNNHNTNSDLDVGTWVVVDTDGFSPAQAFNILDCAVDLWDWLSQPQVLNRFPNSSEALILRWSTTNSSLGGSYYTGTYINISSPASGDTDGWADTVILHECGHYVSHRFHQDDNTGGSHFLGDNFQDPRLSYGEGYATYLCGEVRETRAVAHGTDAHVSLYADLAMPPAVGIPGALEFSYDFETGAFGNGTSLGQVGQASETNITSTLWDLFDGASTPDESMGSDDDSIDDDGSDVWDVLLGYMATIPPAEIITYEDFVQGWKTVLGPTYLATEFDFIQNDLNRMGFEEDAQEQDDTVAAATAMPMGAYSLIGAMGGVVMNEIEPGGEDAIELYNSSNTAVDITGWQILASSNTTTTLFTFPSYLLQPGAFVYVRERGSSTNNTDTDLYGGSAFSIPWANGSPGACALQNSMSTAQDFLRWDGVGNPSTTAVPLGLTWTGSLMSPPGSDTIGRDGLGTDTDAASDWSPGPNSGTQPNGLAYNDHTSFDVDDADYLSLNLQKDRIYSVRTFAPFGAADTYLELLAADGTTLLAANDDRGPVLNESNLTFLAPATGTFYARITHVGAFTQYGIYRARAYEHPPTGVLGSPLALMVEADNTHVSGDAVTLGWLNGSVYDSVHVFVSDATSTVQSATVAGDATTLATQLDRGLYRVQVQGEQGMQTSGSAEACVYAGVFPTSFTESYDTAAGLYSWEPQSPWGLTSAVASNGPNSVTDSPAGDYGDNVDVSLESKLPVRLGVSAVLQFRHICITEADFDYGYVQITADDGQTWSTLAFYDMSAHPGWADGVASNGDFVQENIPLTGYDNQVVRIRFRLVSDGGVTEDGWYVDDVVISSDVTDAPELPAFRYALYGNEPNPFNPRTTIRYSLAAPQRVDLRVYDLRGRLVRTLVAAPQGAGPHVTEWDGRDGTGRAVASGVYFYRLDAGAFEDSRKMLLLK